MFFRLAIFCQRFRVLKAGLAKTTEKMGQGVLPSSRTLKIETAFG
jgi:hypothetical protein